MKHCKAFATALVLGSATLTLADRPVEGATGRVRIINQCQDPVYLRSVGDNDLGETTLAPGGNWSEPYKQKDKGGGPSIKIRTKVTDILQFEYTALINTVWYNLSYVNCWLQNLHSGEKCPFWKQSFVVESPSGQPHIPCRTGETCPYVYHCPFDDRGLGVTTIAGGPVVNHPDPTKDLVLWLCPCEHDPDSRACRLAQGPGLPIDEARAEKMKGIGHCPDSPDLQSPAEHGPALEEPTMEYDSTFEHPAEIPSEEESSWDYSQTTTDGSEPLPYAVEYDTQYEETDVYGSETTIHAEDDDLYGYSPEN